MRPGGLHGRDKEHYNGVDPLEMSTLRISFNAFTSLSILTFKYNKKVTDFPRHLYKTMAVRSTLGVFAFVFMTYGVSYLPISIF